MKLLVLVLAFVFMETVANGQIETRLQNETAEKFVKRITSTERLSYSIIETIKWGSESPLLIAFLRTPDEITVGLIFVPMSNFSYRQILIDSFSTYGNTARIDSVFFCNVDKDKADELIIMTTFNQSKGKRTNKIYWNLIFDNLDISNPPKRLNYLKAISEKIDGVKFKNALDIIKELLKLE